MRGRFSSFLLGGIIGAAVGLLYAPKTGKETRDELKKLTDEYLDQGRQTYEAQRERVLEAVDTGRTSAVEKSEELKSRIQETRDKLKAQVDAAADAAREKIHTAAGKLQEVTEEKAETKSPE